MAEIQNLCERLEQLPGVHSCQSGKLMSTQSE